MLKLIDEGNLVFSLLAEVFETQDSAFQPRIIANTAISEGIVILLSKGKKKNYGKWEKPKDIAYL